MTYGEMNNYITHVSDSDLVALCKSVYEFKNGNGVLEYAITEEAHKRYEQIVSLLMKDAPAHYLK